MKQLGAYIHIPFCIKKCAYCDFISFENYEKIQENYVQALIKEIKHWITKNKDNKFDTIYIGGGTPSYLDSKYIIEILECLKPNIISNCEITIEVNPGTVNLQKLKDYKEAGINRLSIGLQSTKESLLNILGRIHNYEQFIETYNNAREIGFNNINVDLMIGVPTQTIEDIKDSLEKIIKLSPEHVSVYSLILEENTLMKKLVDEGRIILPDEEIERNMYWYVKDYLELNGYYHYEISNFAKKDHESKHNLNCWDQKEYIGFGIASHSYIDNIRFSNITDINKYIENIKNNNFSNNIIIEERQNDLDKRKEFMMLGLRKIEGVSIKEFKNKFVDNPLFIFRRELNKLCNLKLIKIDDDRIQLTSNGLNLANQVWMEFV